VIGASGLSDNDNGKNDGLKWKLAESVRYRNDILPLVRYRQLKIQELIEEYGFVQIILTWEAQK
jgi:hypothetical protein